MAEVYDIVVLGATGFTGRLITRYLAGHPEYKAQAFTLAIAGRSEDKLKSLVASESLPDAVGVLAVDVTNSKSLEVVVQQAKVVLTCIGPYWRWGTPVVEACVKYGKQYVDISGEPYWTSEIIDKFHDAAVANGATVVPCCGLDCVPSDVVAFLGNKTLKEAVPNINIAQSCSSWKMLSGISGGSLATMLTAVTEVPSNTLSLSTKPYALSPVEGLAYQQNRLVYTLPHIKPSIYGSFFIIGGSNRTIVERTWGLHEALEGDERSRLRYGPNFVYEESQRASSRLSAALTSWVMDLAMYAVKLRVVRWLISKWLPQPGEGPSEEALQNGYLDVLNITVSENDTDQSAPSLCAKTVVRSHGDGYVATAVLASESALCLLHKEKLPRLGQRGGVLTTMSAFGDILIDRLRASGRMEIESSLLEDAKTR
ncbi:hypothetical protein FISHEDRAFT_63417 [Fistulina hepatica ATCC 64428]|uniref:Saccharopine dehydrogenase NADP binding domain-containing protein n=1 Tax=Fistulina hepatica ATCC 64428 TaxID=1128425 RepID=A0A0D7ANU7_9AGAR|nr:hypothetical protein FISHEDRAFT_63417 [Fistulina hepatica ATCC 64428]